VGRKKIAEPDATGCAAPRCGALRRNRRSLRAVTFREAGDLSASQRPRRFSCPGRSRFFCRLPRLPAPAVYRSRQALLTETQLRAGVPGRAVVDTRFSPSRDARAAPCASRESKHRPELLTSPSVNRAGRSAPSRARADANAESGPTTATRLFAPVLSSSWFYNTISRKSLPFDPPLKKSELPIARCLSSPRRPARSAPNLDLPIPLRARAARSQRGETLPACAFRALAARRPDGGTPGPPYSFLLGTLPRLSRPSHCP